MVVLNMHFFQIMKLIFSLMMMNRVRATHLFKGSQSAAKLSGPGFRDRVLEISLVP